MGWTVGQNNNDGTGQTLVFDDDGNLIEIIAHTGLPIQPLYPALDAAGALATLLVVEGLLELQDAANALGETPEHLQHEALAWSLG